MAKQMEKQFSLFLVLFFSFYLLPSTWYDRALDCWILYRIMVNEVYSSAHYSAKLVFCFYLHKSLKYYPRSREKSRIFC